MFDAKGEVEELDDGGLRVAAAAVLYVLVVWTTCVEDDAVGKTCFAHVFAACQEGSDAVVEDVWVAILVHAHQHGGKFVEAFGEGAQTFGHSVLVPATCGLDGVQHEWDDGGTAGFDGHRDKVEP